MAARAVPLGHRPKVCLYGPEARLQGADHPSVSSSFRFGMGSDAGEQALATRVARLRGADIATVTAALRPSSR
jgi:hypothetical protein